MSPSRKPWLIHTSSYIRKRSVACDTIIKYTVASVVSGVFAYDPYSCFVARDAANDGLGAS
jgi:hypothetical protein